MHGALSLYNSGLSMFTLPQCPCSASFVTSRRPQLAYIDLQEIRCTPGLCGACCPAECDLKQLHNAWLQDNGTACTSLTSTTVLHCIAALCRYLPAFCKSLCCAATWGCGRSGACLPITCSIPAPDLNQQAWNCTASGSHADWLCYSHALMSSSL